MPARIHALRFARTSRRVRAIVSAEVSAVNSTNRWRHLPWQPLCCRAATAMRAPAQRPFGGTSAFPTSSSTMPSARHASRTAATRGAPLARRKTARLAFRLGMMRRMVRRGRHADPQLLLQHDTCSRHRGAACRHAACPARPVASASRLPARCWSCCVRTGTGSAGTHGGGLATSAARGAERRRRVSVGRLRATRRKPACTPTVRTVSASCAGVRAEAHRTAVSAALAGGYAMRSAFSGLARKW